MNANKRESSWFSSLGRIVVRATAVLRAIRVYSRSFAVSCLLLLTPTLAFADGARVEAKNEARAEALYREVRCVQCQSESIADSNAPIAADMRREIRQSITEGKSDEAIRKNLYARYGDYVLFRPRLSKANLILWLAPFLVVGGGAGLLLLIARRQKISETYALSAEEEKKLRELTNSDDG